MILPLLKRWAPGMSFTICLVLMFMAITGCLSPSPGVHNIYIFKLESNYTGFANQVKVGYFGMCTSSTPTDTKLPEPICGSTYFSSQLSHNQTFRYMISEKPRDVVDDLLDLASKGHEIQKAIIHPLLTASCVTLASSLVPWLISLGYARGTKPEDKKLKGLRLGIKFSDYLTQLAVAFAFAAAVSLGQVAAALQHSTTWAEKQGGKVTITGNTYTLGLVCVITAFLVVHYWVCYFFFWYRKNDARKSDPAKFSSRVGTDSVVQSSD